MSNLIRMMNYRLHKNPVTVFFMILSLLAGLLFGGMIMLGSYNGKGYFDDMFIVPLFVIEAGFVSLFIGREYSDGTVRNKVIAGKSKVSIYEAYLYMALVVTTVFTILFLVGFTILAYSVTLKYMPASVIIQAALAFLLINYAWTAIFVFVSVVIASREIGMLVNLVIIVAVMFSAYQIEHMLGQSEYTMTEETVKSVELTEVEVKQVHEGTFKGSYWYEGEHDADAYGNKGKVTYYKDILKEEKVPNPHALGGAAKVIATQIDNIMPYGQVNTYVSYLTEYLYIENDKTSEEFDRAYGSVKYFPLYSLALIVIISVMGILIYRKKDLK